MSNFRFASVTSLLLVLATATFVHADPPIGSGPFADGKVIQASGSGTVASRILQKTSFKPQKGQIKFGIEILSVDTETREKIYAALGSKNVQTRIATVTESAASAETAAAEDGEAKTDLSCRHTVTTGSVVSTAVLSPDQVEQLYALARESDNSKTVSRPSLIASDGQVANFQQQVQRPFLSNLERVEDGENTGVQSEIQVLNEGTELMVMANMAGEALDVQTVVKYSHVADVKEHRVYGLSDETSVIQVPSHEVHQASANQRLLTKQTLLLDPYFESKRVKASTVGTPLLDQLPYVGDAFTATETEEVTTHMLVLIRAKRL